MERYKNIASAYHDTRPYEIAIHWDASPQNIPNTIMLAEGTAHSAFGGNFPLSELLNDRWTQHLEICNCLWLRDLAIEEQSRDNPFSADEIWQIYRNRAR